MIILSFIINLYVKPGIKSDVSPVIGLVKVIQILDTSDPLMMIGLVSAGLGNTVYEKYYEMIVVSCLIFKSSIYVRE